MASGHICLDNLINKGALSVNTRNLLDIGTQCFLGATPEDIQRIWTALNKPPVQNFHAKKRKTWPKDPPSSPGQPVTIATTIDHDLVYTLYEDRHIKTIRNSDEIFALEISPRLRIFSSQYDGTDPLHRAYFDAAETGLAREFTRLLSDLPYELVY